MTYASPSDGTGPTIASFADAKVPPFIAWLRGHGLLDTASSWECKYQPRPFDGHEGPVFRRKGPAPLIVRPKRHTYA